MDCKRFKTVATSDNIVQNELVSTLSKADRVTHQKHPTNNGEVFDGLPKGNPSKTTPLFP